MLLRSSLRDGFTSFDAIPRCVLNRKRPIPCRGAVKGAVDRSEGNQAEGSAGIVTCRHQESKCQSLPLWASSDCFMVQFFEPASDSPRKRQRLEVEEPCDEIHDEPEERHTDAMPGFYEHEEIILQTGEDRNEDDQAEHTSEPMEKPKERVRPPVSAPSRPSSSSAKLEGVIQRPKPKPLTKERSKSDVGPRPVLSFDARSDKTVHVCPICSRTLATDNHGLNAHIDFCLSRGAIEEARAQTTSTHSNTPGNKAAMKPSSVTASDWGFLMSQKGMEPKSKGGRTKK